MRKVFTFYSIPHNFVQKNPSKSPFRKGGVRGIWHSRKTSKIINSFAIDYKCYSLNPLLLRFTTPHYTSMHLNVNIPLNAMQRRVTKFPCFPRTTVLIFRHDNRPPFCHCEALPLCHCEALPLCHCEALQCRSNPQVSGYQLTADSWLLTALLHCLVFRI